MQSQSTGNEEEGVSTALNLPHVPQSRRRERDEAGNPIRYRVDTRCAANDGRRGAQNHISIWPSEGWAARGVVKCTTGYGTEPI